MPDQGEKKVIQINPDFFKVNKTQKAGRGSLKPKGEKPLVSPDVLRKKLLDRIKKRKKAEVAKTNGGVEVSTEAASVVNEFNNAINYLNVRSSENKVQGGGFGVSTPKTFKNYQAMTSPGPSPFVNLDLPETLLPQDLVVQSVSSSPPLQLNYKVDQVVPYGCMKGGIKPTYRAYNKTIRNDPNVVSLIEQKQNTMLGGSPSSVTFSPSPSPSPSPFVSSTPSPSPSPSPSPITSPFVSSTPSPSPSPSPITSPNVIEKPIHSPLKKGGDEESSISNHSIKRTIKQRYKLGKSANGKSVGILIKDRKSRAQITKAQNTMRKKPVNDMKSYLKERGLLKVGSNAPNDVIRKMFESAMLTGDVFNHSSETLLHNFCHF